MKQIKLIFSAALCALLFFTACEKDPEGNGDETQDFLSGLLILNNGSWGDNNASVSLYDPETKQLTANMFYDANGRGLGDLGQDIMISGEDVYIAVNGSQIIFVTDKSLKIKKEITAEVGGNKLSPRYFAAGGDKVYVTYYEGYLGEIDPSKDYAVRTTAVGPNPEGVAYAGGNLYVANSGGYVDGYNNTVSIVNASSFTETSTITVNTNPCAVIANASETIVYVSSFGNYTDLPSMLQAINVSDKTVSDTGYENVSGVTYGKNDKLYVLCGGYDSEWNPFPGTIYAHNAATNSKAGVFAAGGITIPEAYSISADVATGYVFAGSSDYKNTGDIYLFSEDGKLVDTFDTGGINPLKGISIGR